MSDEVGAIVAVYNVYSILNRVDGLDINAMNTYLSDNKTQLIESGECAHSDKLDDWGGCPFLLYPKVEFMSKSEMQTIDREAVYLFKIGILGALRDISNENWLKTFLSYLQSNSKIIDKCQFYFNTDAVYSVQSQVDQSSFRFPSSGGLSECLEMAYIFYERHHFAAHKELSDYFSEFQPLEPINDIQAFKAYFDRHNEDNWLYDFGHMYSDRRSRFRDNFIRDVNITFGLHPDNAMNKDQDCSKFRFSDQILNDFSKNPFAYSPDFRWIRYGSETFNLTPEQGNIIKVLYNRHLENNGSYTPQKVIASDINAIDGTTIVDSFRLDQRFRIKTNGATKYKNVFHRLVQEKDSKERDRCFRIRLPITPTKNLKN